MHACQLPARGGAELPLLLRIGMLPLKHTYIHTFIAQHVDSVLHVCMWAAIPASRHIVGRFATPRYLTRYFRCLVSLLPGRCCRIWYPLILRRGRLPLKHTYIHTYIQYALSYYIRLETCYVHIHIYKYI